MTEFTPSPEPSREPENPQTGKLSLWLKEAKKNAVHNTANHPWLVGSTALLPPLGVAAMFPPEKQGAAFLAGIVAEGIAVIVGAGDTRSS